MNAEDAASHFLLLYGEVHRLSYRRRDPRSKSRSGEALAMLQHLRDSGPLTVTEAALHFDRSQAAISERVRSLVADGLVERVPDRRDRRCHLVWITEKGERLLETELDVLSRETITRGMNGMGAKERDRLIETLEALVGNLSNPE